MTKKQENLHENDYSGNDCEANTHEKTLILLEGKAKKKLDEPVSTPDPYVSRFQYNSQNLDKYLEICPHCKNPMMVSFHRTVIDSAIDYLEGKRMFNQYQTKDRDNLSLITLLALFVTGLYFLLPQIISIIGA
jgi:hypothetical protein